MPLTVRRLLTTLSAMSFMATSVVCAGTLASADIDWRVGGRGSVLTSDGVKIEFRICRHLPGTSGRSVFMAQAETGGTICIIRNGNAFSAIFPGRVSAERRIVRWEADGSTCRIVRSTLSEEGCLSMPEEVPLNVLYPGLCMYYIEAEPPESDGKDTLLDVVDILVAYDAPAQKWLQKNGWSEGTFAELQVGRMNTVLENSGLLDMFRFRLVGTKNLTANVAKLGTGNTTRFTQALASLNDYTQQPLVAGTGLRGLVEARYATGADIAVLLTDTGSTAGTLGASYGLLDSASGWDSDSNLAFSGRRAFAVCEIGEAEAGYVMTHEVGHVLGAGHPTAAQVNPNAIDCGPQLFGYSSAYLFDYGGERHYTVMGYPFDGLGNEGFKLVEAFSSPLNTLVVGGTDTGVSLGVAGVHDNAATLARSFSCVARYRTHVLPDENREECRVTVASTDGGTASGSGFYYVGEKATLSATCQKGYCFAGWHVVDGQGNTNALQSVADYRATSCAVTVDGTNTSFVARFVKKGTDTDPIASLCATFDPTAMRAGVSVDIAPALEAVSASRPTYSVSGLPPGLKFASGANRLYGTPTKPGNFAVTLAAKNQSGAKLSRKLAFAVGNWRDDALPFEDACGPFVPGVCFSTNFPFAAKCSASGLPAGVSWRSAQATLFGTPTKPGTNTIVFTRKDKDPETGAGVSRKASLSFVVAPKPMLYLESFGPGTGLLKGGGAYLANKRLTVSAVPDTKDRAATVRTDETVRSAFAGWWSEEGLLQSLSKSYALTMPERDFTLFGKFVTMAEDAESMAFSLNGASLSDECASSSTNLCGVTVNWPVRVTALSSASVSVSGLPTGLKYDARKQAVTGVPTVASSRKAKTGEIVPSKVRFKVKSGGGNVRTYALDVSVMALPSWACGTFDGGGDGMLATFSVTGKGKWSGKLLRGAETWTLSAASFSSGVYDAEAGARDLSADIFAKCGKRASTNHVELAEDGLAGTFDGVPVTATRNPWGEAEYLELAARLKTLPAIEVEHGGTVFSFSFTKKGTLLAAARFSDRYAASASAALCVARPPEDGFLAYAYLHFPPVPSKGFAGCDAAVSVGWDGVSATVEFCDRETD